METKTTLPRPTMDIVEKFNTLEAQCSKLLSQNKIKEVSPLQDELDRLIEEYDWFDKVYTDPVTNKKGIVDVTGKVLVPPYYDDFCETYNYMYMREHPVPAVRDGRFGIVRTDGSGEELCEFKYDYISTVAYSFLYLACWDGDKEHSGVITAEGKVICPNILDQIYEIFNDIIVIKRGEKYGVIDEVTLQCVLPEYDDVKLDTEDFVVFYKDGKVGYVTDKGEFITKEQYDEDERYEDANLICTRL